MNREDYALHNEVGLSDINLPLRIDPRLEAVKNAYLSYIKEEDRTYGGVKIVHCGRCGKQLDALLSALDEWIKPS